MKGSCAGEFSPRIRTIELRNARGARQMLKIPCWRFVESDGTIREEGTSDTEGVALKTHENGSKVAIRVHATTHSNAFFVLIVTTAVRGLDWAKFSARKRTRKSGRQERPLQVG
jgi:hypothetical protein